jgi:ABC-type Mn2+/Zn2+ transport system ATPase subunit
MVQSDPIFRTTCLTGFNLIATQGKTTFLNLLSGKIDRTGGIVKINGEEADLGRYRKIIGYVPQEDVMIRDLTVEENVTHSALMRLPLKWSREKKLAHVDEILEALEIDHVRDVVVGNEMRRGISGGERKRVNIAMEMVTKPSLLCLDEPTSGLVRMIKSVCTALLILSTPCFLSLLAWISSGLDGFVHGHSIAQRHGRVRCQHCFRYPPAQV